MADGVSDYVGSKQFQDSLKYLDPQVAARGTGEVLALATPPTGITGGQHATDVALAFAPSGLENTGLSFP